MKRTVNIFIGFIVGLVFMKVPLNLGVHGFIVSPIESLFTVIGGFSVAIFGSVLLHQAFKNLTSKKTE